MRRRLGPVVSGLALAGLGSACALVVSACGSSSKAASPTTSPSTTASSTTASSTTVAPTTVAPTTPTTGTTAAAGNASFAAYQSCLKAHGVTFGAGGGGFLRRGGAPGGSTTTTGGTATGTATIGGTTTAAAGAPPAGRPGFTPTAAQQKALSACASLRPAGGFGFGGGAGTGGFNTNNPAFAKFTNCLKQHGVQTGAGAARTSPAFQTALAACRSLLPAGAFQGGAGGAPPGGATGAGGAPSSTFAQFQACLRQHGVQTAGAGQQSSKTQAAIAACRALLPGGGAGTSTSGTSTTATTTTG